MKCTVTIGYLECQRLSWMLAAVCFVLPCMGNEIHEAALAGELTNVQRLIAADTKLLRERDATSATPLLIAAQWGRAEVVEFLLSRGGDVNTQDSDGSTALHRAALCGHTNVIRLLLEHGADVNARDAYGCTPLHSAVEIRGHERAVELLLAAGADINAKDTVDNLRETPLLKAVREGNRGVAKLLGSRGARLDICSAVALGRQEQVERFLAADSALISTTLEGSSLLHIAAGWGQAGLAALLLDKGLDANLVCPPIRGTPLHAAANCDHPDVVALLLKRGAHFEAKTTEGYTPLFLAVIKGYVPIVELLAKSGANISTKNNDGFTPLHWATWKDNLEMARTLIRLGANPNARDRAGDTPLQIAALGGFTEIARLLLANGARVNTWNWRGETPLWSARNHESDEMRGLLKSHGGRQSSVMYRCLIMLAGSAVVALVGLTIWRKVARMKEGHFPRGK
jgi:ankyrin repeat protein